MPEAGGGTDQRRPSFGTFADARQCLVALEREWGRKLVAHKKAARARK